ncbi:MAG: CoA-acylating methylmalonate-semialdehyde dehydrogenase [Cyclobacteriaceae bacterium]|nr:CoA-acylating methylmalonate-semialdehyde dehydrogenase [Cyclobacteriaceae bacterium]
MKYSPVRNFINGQWSAPSGSAALEVESPLNGATLSSVTMSSVADLEGAVKAAQAAQQLWAKVPIKERVQVFFRYKRLLEANMKELSDLIREENGKTWDEAKAEIEKAIELTEFACAMPALVSGELLEVSKGVECRIDRVPVGVVASIVPFNFPSMVPHWTIPNALVLGNAMIVKPSELVPLSCQRIATLLQEAGLPDGLFNTINGDKEMVNAICDHPGIQTVTFVGSTKVAKLVYARAAANMKRVLALGGAKNHLIVLPDAHPDMAGSNIAASMTGCAGQRCMAASAMVAVGKSDHIIERLCEEARKIQPGVNLGSVITRQAKERIERYITEAEAAGAHILVDGRKAVVPGAEGGYYVGPTVIDHVKPDMAIAREEVFGPVIAIMRTDTLEEAIRIENNNPYGNGASVFTQSGGLARQVAEQLSAGMVGVNIGVPVPREPFSFGGWNESKFGMGDITGKSSIDLWTRLKKTTVKWNPESRTNWMS